MFLFSLSKRIVSFASRESENDFNEELKVFNKAMVDIFGVSPLQKYVSGKKGGFTLISEDPAEFEKAMENIIPGLVKKLQERAPGSKRGITNFYDRIMDAVGNLILSAHQVGLTSAPFLKRWAIALLNEIKPGSPFGKN
jgi:hypothetical protein